VASISAPKLFSRSEKNTTVRGFVLRSEIIFAFGAGIIFLKNGVTGGQEKNPKMEAGRNGRSG
jgi:hypothetical protein